MDKLPVDVINLIYEFDCTKRENFDKVIEQFKREIEYIYDSLETEEVLIFKLGNLKCFDYFKLKKAIIQENIIFHEHFLRTTEGRARENYIKGHNWALKHGFNPFWIN